MTTIDAHHDHHDPNLAHHFDTPEQQFSSAKLGMWVFLATEILMFGGLFCAYAVYRGTHPEVFLYAHHFLDTFWGAFNTVVLIASSFTMAWGVRAAQLGQRGLLILLLVLTLLGGFGFMIVKTIEYSAKWEHATFVGPINAFYSMDGSFTNEDKLHHALEYGEKKMHKKIGHVAAADAAIGLQDTTAEVMHLEEGDHAVSAREQAEQESQLIAEVESAANDRPAPPEHSDISRPQVAPAGLSELFQDVGGQPEPFVAVAAAQGHAVVTWDMLTDRGKSLVSQFFQIYFMMTGLHGIHVLIGMALIAWILYRALLGQFGPKYYTPVDLVGLYWHLVDLIWIFLFPLLYLIH